LGLDENVGGVAYPTTFRVDDALTIAQIMGAKVVRSHTLGISVGHPLSVEPTLGVFNETALQHIDYAIKAARDHGIRLIIPFTDNWRYYHGGKHTFTEWRNINRENLFYTDATVIDDFKQYIQQLLNRVNSYTGITYKNDPTILAWETGNELSPTSSWTKTIADFIKGIDGLHLVMDGNSGVDVQSIAVPSVDIFTDHYYPITTSLLTAQESVAKYKQKAFIVGEYDWTGSQGGDELAGFLPTVEKSSGVSGDLYWALFAHNDTYGYVLHDDSYSLHYPGDTPDRSRRVQLLATHAYKMSGRSVPTLPAPGAPLITSIQGNKIAWQGTALASKYTVERSTDGNSWTIVCDQCATDKDTPWTEQSMPSRNVSYRVKGYNLSGVAGPYSPIFTVSHN
jgi:hypothetical protein